MLHEPIQELLLAELYAFAGWLAKKIAKLSAGSLPPELQERFLQEWQKRMDESIPTNIGKFAYSLALIPTAIAIRRDHGATNGHAPWRAFDLSVSLLAEFWRETAKRRRAGVPKPFRVYFPLLIAPARVLRNLVQATLKRKPGLVLPMRALVPPLYVVLIVWLAFLSFLIPGIAILVFLILVPSVGADRAERISWGKELKEAIDLYFASTPEAGPSAPSAMRSGPMR